VLGHEKWRRGRHAAQEENAPNRANTGGTGKKIPTDKSRDFMNGGNLKYERAAAKVGIFFKIMSNAHL
jgi:hypothetical protein